jgi:nitroreductase
MSFNQLIKKRYSVRAYKSDPVAEELIGKILEAAQLAPTAANRQPLQIFVIKTEGREEKLKRVYGNPWFTQAPFVIAVCGFTK